MVAERLARSPAEAAAAAGALGDRLLLKILWPDITHKAEAGGVLLDVPPGEVTATYDRLVAQVGAPMPRARIDGVLLSPMLRDGVESIIRVQMDPVFGPVVMFGLRGIFVEVLRDVTFRIAPFGAEEGRHMIGEIKGSAVLEGARGRPPADVEALAAALARLSQAAAAWRARFARCRCARAAPTRSTR